MTTTFLSRATLQKMTLGLLTAQALWMPLAQAQHQPQTQLPRAHLQIGMYRVEVQVALTAQQQEIGLMHRASMPENEGMLFDFGDSQTRCFWMKNTLIPLTAAFIAKDGTILNLANMQPLSEKPHCSTQPARYVLELNQDWFQKRGLREGLKIKPVSQAPRISSKKIAKISG